MTKIRTGANDPDRNPGHDPSWFDKYQPIARHYPRAATLSPADKVARDREQQAAKIAAREARHATRRAADPNRCRICGTPISDPRSLERGIGPSCHHKLVTSPEGGPNERNTP